MRTINPARALHHGAGQHARATEQFQAKARAHDIDNGIQRADFVEMHFVRRMPVNLSLRHRDAMKYRHGFLLHPIGEQTVANEPPDFREVAAVLMRVAVIVIVAMLLVVVVMRVRFVFLIVVAVLVRMAMAVLMFMRVRGAVGVRVFVRRARLVRQMHVELHAFNL